MQPRIFGPLAACPAETQCHVVQQRDPRTVRVRGQDDLLAVGECFRRLVYKPVTFSLPVGAQLACRRAIGDADYAAEAGLNRRDRIHLALGGDQRLAEERFIADPVDIPEDLPGAGLLGEALLPGYRPVFGVDPDAPLHDRYCNAITTKAGA